MSSIVTTFKHYAVFRGRADRREFWIFFAFYLLVMLALTSTEIPLGLFGSFKGHQYGYLSSTFWVLSVLPGLSLTVRRLHDTGRSGWWVLSQIVPVVGGLVLLVMLALPSAESQPDTSRPLIFSGEGVRSW